MSLVSCRLLGPLAAMAMLASLAGCGDTRPPSLDTLTSSPDAAITDRPPSGDAANKAGNCASAFGSALTAAFGRLDGTLLAVVTPADTQCAQPNSTHLVVQVTMNGAAYRMVLNVESTFAGVDPRVRFAEVQRPLPAPAWSEGWHTGVALDYPTTLGVHTADFAPYEMNALVEQVSDRLGLGQRLSVYATSSGGSRADSAHLIHRNGDSTDGAIVVGPDSATPSFLLFHFADQTF